MYYFLYDNHNSRNEAKLNENKYERKICENCNCPSAIMEEPLNFGIKGKLYDCYNVGSDFVISERFLNVLRENAYTGYEIGRTSPVRWSNKNNGEPIKEVYYQLKIVGRCGLICDLSGEPLPYCRKCHRKIGCTGLVTTGVSFDSKAYDDSDLFAFENMKNRPIVSEEIKEVLIKSNLILIL